MSEEYKSQLFRLATVLYADNNYEVAPKTIHRKIIESVLLECNAKEFSVHQIIDFIQDNYSITFEEEAIKDIVYNDKEERFLTNYSIATKMGYRGIHGFGDAANDVRTRPHKRTIYKKRPPPVNTGKKEKKKPKKRWGSRKDAADLKKLESEFGG